jgi:uncharacterized protein RhaS with RHS repeats
MQQTVARHYVSASPPIPPAPLESYYRARYYDPSSGRFLSEDPMAFGAGVNFYSYVLENPLSYVDPDGTDVTIVIGSRTYSPSGDSVAGTISVTSDQTSLSFSGFTLENPNAGDDGSKPPIPAGTYGGFIRPDHEPNRIQLKNVPGYTNIQIHNGSYPRNFKGCFGAGTSPAPDFLGGTINAMHQILAIVKADGTGHIKIIVGPIQQGNQNNSSCSSKPTGKCK